MKKFFVSLALLSVPASAFALGGIGPRVNINATIEEVIITDEQRFEEEGAELKIRTEEGQLVTAVVVDNTRIVTEGRLSRKKAIPSDLREGMSIRVSGWRVGTDALTASLILITNVETNPAFSGNAVIQSVGTSTVVLQTNDGQSRTFGINGDTEISINYEMNGMEALTLEGKQVQFTINPNNNSQLKVLRILGRPQATFTRPTQRELRSIRYRTNR